MAKKRAAPPPMDARRTRARTNAPPILDIAKHLECPICMSLFHDPVTLSCGGQTFDLDCIRAHIAQDKSTCPMSRTDLTINPYATPSVVIRSIVADYIEKHPGAGELTPRQSFEPIDLFDPKIRIEAKLKALVKQLQEAVELEDQEDLMNKLSDAALDEETAQMLATLPDALLLLVRVLSSENEDCRYNAAWTLARVSSSDEGSALMARTRNALIKLTSLLAPSESDYVRAAAARAIRNVAINEETRRLVLDVPGIIGSVAQCLSSENLWLLSDSKSTLGRLSFDEQAAFAILRTKGVLPNLVRGMRHDDVGAVVRRECSCFALYNLADHTCNKRMIANHPNALTLLVQCLRDEDGDVRRHASRALGNLSSDLNSIRTKIAAIPDALMLLIQLERDDPSEDVRESAETALGNLSRNPKIRTTIERLKRQRQ